MTDKYIDDQKLAEMFNDSFLPAVGQLAKDLAEREKDLKIKLFRLDLSFEFDEGKNDLQYEDISNRINMRLVPFTQEDLETIQEAQEKKEENSLDE